MQVAVSGLGSAGIVLGFALGSVWAVLGACSNPNKDKRRESKISALPSLGTATSNSFVQVLVNGLE